MLTARAEYRLRLRADNAEARLTPLAIAAGCVSMERRDHFDRQRARTVPTSRRSLAERVSASELSGAGIASERRRAPAAGRMAALSRTRRGRLARLVPDLADVQPGTRSTKAVQDHRYAPLCRAPAGGDRAAEGDEAIRIPADLDYAAIPGLSNEMVERLTAARPATLGAAGRIRGITPAALAAILVHARRKAA